MQHELEYSYPCRLYIISPPNFALDEFADLLCETLQAGDVGAFQLRLKDTDDKLIYEAAEKLLPICKNFNTAFIINDRADIAASIGADGVHLGQKDMSVKEARKIIGTDSSIGVSCHDSSHMAMLAGEQGADYIAFGAFYPTKSKAPEKLAQYGTPTTDMLEWWYKYTIVPSVAIGGITPANCGELVAAGADFIAAINAIWEHKDSPATAVKEFNNAIKKNLKLRKNISDEVA